MIDVLLLGIWGASFHFLAYRAEITRWLWFRYPKWLDGLLGCCACSGFWVGGAVGWAYWYSGTTIVGLSNWLIVPASALITMVASPIASFAQIYALQALNSNGSEEIRD